MKTHQEFNIETDTENVSYSEIMQKVASLAAKIEARIGEGTVIGVCLPLSVDLVVTFLAICDLGLDYFPIAYNGSRPPLKLAEYVKAVKPEFIITLSDIEPLPGLSCSYLYLDQISLTEAPVKMTHSSGHYVFCNPHPVKFLLSDLQQHLIEQSSETCEKIALLDKIAGRSHIIEILTAETTNATLCMPPQSISGNLHKTKNFLKERSATNIRVDYPRFGFVEDVLTIAELQPFVKQLGDIFTDAKVNIYNRKNKNKRFRVSIELLKEPSVDDVQKMALLQTLVKRSLHVAMYPSCFTFEKKRYFLQCPIGNPYELNETEKSLIKMVFAEVRKIHPELKLELEDEVRKIHPEPKLGVEDDFFQLGLTSYQLNKLAISLHEVSRKITLSTILKYPSVGRLARFVGRDNLEKLIKPLDEKKLRGTKTKLIWIHALLGNAEHEYAFVKELWSKTQHPFDTYIISSRALKYPGQMGVTLEDIASDYLRVIRDEFGDSPIVLAGWSAGGHIIYEMQQQLAPNTVPAIFVDTWHFDFFQKSSPEAFANLLLHKFSMWFAESCEIKYPIKDLSVEFLKDCSHKEQVRWVFSKIREVIRSLNIPTNEEAVRQSISVEKMLYAILSYQFKALEFPVKLIAADPRLKGNPDTIQGWRSYIENIECVQNSDHGSLFGIGKLKDRAQHLSQMSNSLIHFAARHNAMILIHPFVERLKAFYVNKTNSKLSRFKLPDKPIESCYVNLVVVNGCSEERVSLVDILPENTKQASRVVVQGVAGIGKSTFCQKIAHDWVKGKIWPERFELLAWIKLRHLNSDIYLTEKNFDLVSLIKDSCSIRDNDFSEEYLDILSDKMLIMLDGWDEFIAKNKNINCIRAIKDLLANNKYHIILTTRPGFSLDFSVDRQLQITGFEYDDALKMLQDNMPSKSVSSSVLPELFRANPLLKEYVKTPIIAEMLSYLLANTVMNDVANYTVTRVFSDINKLLLERSIIKDSSAISENGGQGLELSLTALKELESNNKLLSSLLAKIAFQMEISNKLFIDSRELGGIILENKSIYIAILRKSGLFHLLDSSGDIEQYEFHHRALQAFYAAKHIVSQYKSVEARQLIESHKYNINFQMVWYFTAGLLSENVLLVQDFFSRLAQDTITIYNRHILGLLIRSINEARGFLQNISSVENYVTTLVGRWLLGDMGNFEPYVVNKIQQELIGQISYSSYLVNKNQLVFRYLKKLLQAGELERYKLVSRRVYEVLDVSSIVDLFSEAYHSKLLSELDPREFGLIKKLLSSVLRKPLIKGMVGTCLLFPFEATLQSIVRTLDRDCLIEVKPVLLEYFRIKIEQSSVRDQSGLEADVDSNVRLKRLYADYKSQCSIFRCADQSDEDFDMQWGDSLCLSKDSHETVEDSYSDDFSLLPYDEIFASHALDEYYEYKNLGDFSLHSPGELYSMDEKVDPVFLNFEGITWDEDWANYKHIPRDEDEDEFDEFHYMKLKAALCIYLSSRSGVRYAVSSDVLQSSMLRCIEVLMEIRDPNVFHGYRNVRALKAMCLFKVKMDELSLKLQDSYLNGLWDIVEEKKLNFSINAIILLNSMPKHIHKVMEKNFGRDKILIACFENFNLKNLQHWMPDINDEKWFETFMMNYSYDPVVYNALILELFFQNSQSKDNKLEKLLRGLYGFSSSLFFRVVITKSFNPTLLRVFSFQELIDMMIGLTDENLCKWLMLLSRQEVKEFIQYYVSGSRSVSSYERMAMLLLLRGAHGKDIEVSEVYEQLFIESKQEDTLLGPNAFLVVSALDDVNVPLIFMLARKYEYKVCHIEAILIYKDISCLLLETSSAQMLNDYSAESIVKLFKSSPIDKVILSCLGNSFEQAKRVLDILIVEREVNLQLMGSHLLIHMNGATISAVLDSDQKNLLEGLLNHKSSNVEYSDAALIAAHRQVFFGAKNCLVGIEAPVYSSTL